MSHDMRAFIENPTLDRTLPEWGLFQKMYLARCMVGFSDNGNVYIDFAESVNNMMSAWGPEVFHGNFKALFWAYYLGIEGISNGVEMLLSLISQAFELYYATERGVRQFPYFLYCFREDLWTQVIAYANDFLELPDIVDISRLGVVFHRFTELNRLAIVAEMAGYQGGRNVANYINSPQFRLPELEALILLDVNGFLALVAPFRAVVSRLCRLGFTDPYDGYFLFTSPFFAAVGFDFTIDDPLDYNMNQNDDRMNVEEPEAPAPEAPRDQGGRFNQRREARRQDFGRANRDRYFRGTGVGNLTNMAQIAQEFFQHIKGQIEDVRPYPFYKLSSTVTIDRLHVLAAFIDGRMTLENTDVPFQLERDVFAGPVGNVCTPVEYLSYVDTFVSLYPREGPRLTALIDTPGAPIEAVQWKLIMEVYRNLVAPPSEAIMRHVDYTKTQALLEEYLNTFWHSLPQHLSGAEKERLLRVQLSVIANNPRYLAYLRSKVISGVQGNWNIASAHVQQAQLEKVYDTIQGVTDFVNEPKVMELRKTLSEFYNIKKRVSTDKRVSDVIYTIPREAGVDITYKEQVYAGCFTATVNLLELHSLYVTFPRFSRDTDRDPIRQACILYQVEYTVPGRPVKTIDLYRISKITESSGVPLRPKAYIYWIRQITTALFNSLPGGNAPDISSPRQVPEQLESANLRVSFYGYNPGTDVGLHWYNFEMGNFRDFPFLKGYTGGQKFAYLLDMISKQNYKLEKYRERVAKRQKYTMANQNSRMLNTIYERFGPRGNTK